MKYERFEGKINSLGEGRIIDRLSLPLLIARYFNVGDVIIIKAKNNCIKIEKKD